MPEGEQSIVVITEENRRYKLVMRGALHSLTVEKIKRYLGRTTGIDPADQVLTHGGRLLGDDMVGEDFGLAPDDILELRRAAIKPAVPPLYSNAGHLEGTHDGDAMTPPPSARTLPSARETIEASNRRGQAPMGLATPRGGAQGDAASAAPYGVSPTPHARRGGGPTDAAVSSVQSYTQQQQPPTPRVHHHQQQQQLQDMDNEWSKRVAKLEEENQALRAELDQLQHEQDQKRLLQQQGPPQLTVIANARANLDELGKELGVHLTLDDNLSCVVGGGRDENTLIVTVDPPTERMYVYSTLTTAIPEDAHSRLRLYEAVLDWSLLGREMVGGGVGLCPRSGLLMMSTSIDLRHCDRTALKDSAPMFVESLSRWRSAVSELLHGR